MLSIFRARANFRTVQAISGRASKMATICCLRSPTALKGRRRELEARLQQVESRQQHVRLADQKAAEDAAIAYVLDQLGPTEVEHLVQQALALLPEPLVRRNPTLSNPFVRGKVYELACGEPID